jgi:DNA-binding NtrC family response regulator
MHPTALIVEDDPATIEILPQVLHLHLPILTVETAHSYDGTCDRLGRQPYSVVLTDVRMPRIEGFAVLKTVRAVQPHTPVILMSTLVDVLESHAFDAGAFDVLPKPFRRESLIATLCQALQAHRISGISRPSTGVCFACRNAWPWGRRRSSHCGGEPRSS